MKVAFIGTGRMGAPMALNLLRAGHSVSILASRGRAGAEELIRAGANETGSLSECAQGSDLAVLMLPGTREVSAVIEGDSGLGRAMAASSIVVDCSTSLPAATRLIGKRLAQREVGFIDAPVVRGVSGAKSGTLSFFIGGESEVITRAMPVLSAMGDTFTRVGKLGAGHTVKALNNLLSLGHLALLAEVLELAERNSVEFSPLVQALMSGNARSATLEQHASRLQSNSRESVLFRLSLAAKDLSLAAELSNETSYEKSPARFFASLYSYATEYGLNDEDITTIREIFRSDGRKNSAPNFHPA
ncbi:NAD(P)-dependent oxidoreductase [Pelagibacterium luteolum]|uniref:3-hydroxyisobutyrate dehydrogenase n=1 Tax=Pelagibacterium luteolum TaxID=440168 RepID=A0A1G7ZT50_9HYPH|nr:NAD(P)-dependent oxidoreductase [Pelagibacterium luteolum]SDH11300.1 3-hydroxyisobutyrate dehydrogenase [Pelagibacterium luteolum]